MVLFLPTKARDNTAGFPVVRQSVTQRITCPSFVAIRVTFSLAWNNLLFNVNKNKLHWLECIPCFVPGVCDVALSAKHGIVTSPKYPSLYPSSLECAWLIDLGPGYDIHLTFQKFELETQDGCTFDYVLVQEGVDEGAPTKARLCSNDLPSDQTTIGPMRIEFNTDADGEFLGFHATYTAYGECVE